MVTEQKCYDSEQPQCFWLSENSRLLMWILQKVIIKVEDEFFVTLLYGIRLETEQRSIESGLE